MIAARQSEEREEASTGECSYNKTTGPRPFCYTFRIRMIGYHANGYLVLSGKEAL